MKKMRLNLIQLTEHCKDVTGTQSLKNNSIEDATFLKVSHDAKFSSSRFSNNKVSLSRLLVNSSEMRKLHPLLAPL